MCGNILLAIPIDALFYPGLMTIAIGTGLLKPTISTLVGQLYNGTILPLVGGFAALGLIAFAVTEWVERSRRSIAQPAV